MNVDLVFSNDGKPLTLGDLLRAASFLDDAHAPDSAEVIVQQDDTARALSIRVQFEYGDKPIEPLDF
jgi:hypothetical protein